MMHLLGKCQADFHSAKPIPKSNPIYGNVDYTAVSLGPIHAEFQLLPVRAKYMSGRLVQLQKSLCNYINTACVISIHASKYITIVII